MRHILFQIAEYSDYRQNVFDEILSPRHQRYCDHQQIEYRVFRQKPETGRPNPIWGKLWKMREIMKEIQEGDVITVLDADMLIVDKETSLVPEEGKSLCYSIDCGNTQCFGWTSFRKNDWSQKVIDLLLDDERYEKYNSDPLWKEWAEQASWYFLTGVPRHSWTPFMLMPNFGFHNYDYGDEKRLSLDEIFENTQLLSAEYNGTILEEEQEGVAQFLQRYRINPIKRDDVKIRHWGGGQKWEPSWYLERNNW
jgi:hypothetical protein